MKYFIFILFLILTMGCVTQKRCMIKFPPDTTSHTEFTHDIFFMDSTIEVVVAGDTAYVESPWSDNIVWEGLPEGVIPPEYTVRHDISPIRAEVPFAYSVAWVENNTLRMELIQKDSILRIRLDSVKQMAIDSVKVSQGIITEVEVVPKWATTYKTLFWFSLGLIVLFLVLIFIFLKIK